MGDPAMSTDSGRISIDNSETGHEVFERMTAIQSELTESGVYLPDDRLARLIIVHNPFTLMPLALSFAGPHDDQYGPVGGSEWGLVASGPLRHEVPDD
jgi:hypothetical protein